MANNPKRIQSLQNAMRVVAAIAASDDGMRLQDIAAAVGLTPGAVHHIVDTLAAEGWLVRAAQPVRYRLGHALPAMVARQGGRQLARIIDGEMIALQRRIGDCSVSCCEAAGLEILLTRSTDAARSGQVTPVTGTVLPPYTSAASVMHLAWWPAERTQAYRELRPFEVHGLPMWGDAKRFAAALAGARDHGHVELPLSDHALRIGVPVLDAGGALAASLTVSLGRVEDAVERKRIIAEACSATTRIQRALQGDDHADAH
jgi:DNA-binding IclR family transcriptional regulator